MQQRRSLAGRPSGTDGSDFSYRMVVDSRYQRVAQGRSRLRALILIQAVVQLVAALPLILSVWKGEAVHALSALSLAIGIFSLLVGELGRRRSRAGLLRVYLVASSVSIVVSVACVFKSNLTFEILIQDIQNAQNWEAKKLELLQGSRVFLGSVLQVVVIKTVISLIHNMSPPKRAS
ncbi:uncharacterized protein LOC116205382 isoform X1 [Punica granatum]|uniref:Uncharacterized protein LOC116205382 isoform X1 n=1 Tax=Punica granatum TaxID=22663 RepID=A0A6P8DPI9_PUNGR|nr:uncharacterized protein LOC116205382 isoform X1 [Punica granatum]